MSHELSPRQQQIITLVALGLSDKEISAQLSLSQHTVRTYLDRLFQHLGCRSRARAVALWMGRTEPWNAAARPVLVDAPLVEGPRQKAQVQNFGAPK